MVMVDAFIGKGAVDLFPYLNDWLVRGRSGAQVEPNIHLIQSTFGALGLLINAQKSTLIPVQQMEFIGANLDATQARVLLPEDRFQAIMVLIRSLQTHSVMAAWKCLSFLGHTLLCMYLVEHTKLCLRPHQPRLATVYSPSRHHYFRLTDVVAEPP